MKRKVENSSQVALKCRRTRPQLQSQTLHPARDCLLHEDLKGRKKKGTLACSRSWRADGEDGLHSQARARLPDQKGLRDEGPGVKVRCRKTGGKSDTT